MTKDRRREDADKSWAGRDVEKNLKKEEIALGRGERVGLVQRPRKAGHGQEPRTTNQLLR
jgi:hypothetical protein